MGRSDTGSPARPAVGGRGDVGRGGAGSPARRAVGGRGGAGRRRLSGRGPGLVGRAGRRASPPSEARDWWAGQREAGPRRGRDRARGAEPARRPLRGEGLLRAESGGTQEGGSRCTAGVAPQLVGAGPRPGPPPGPRGQQGREGRVSPLKEGLPEGPGRCGLRAAGRTRRGPSAACS